MTERFIAVQGSGHMCCLDAHVEDTERPLMIAGKQWKDGERLVFVTVCECDDLTSATLIADALNLAGVK